MAMCTIVEMARLSYEEGKATYLELIESERMLVDSRVEYAETLFNYCSSLTDLEKAVSGTLKRIITTEVQNDQNIKQNAGDNRFAGRLNTLARSSH